MPEVEITHPDRVLFPDARITKADLADYARRIAPVMVPLIAERPAVLQRFPKGITGQGFFQKNTPDHYPDWIRRITVPKREGGTVDHVIVDSADVLVYLANLGVTTVHLLATGTARLEVPVELLLDLDPASGDPAEIVAAAGAVRELLDDLRVTGFVKATGSRGLHVHLPLRGDARFDAVGALGRALTDELVDRHPDTLTRAFHKADRGDRLYLDLRTAYGQHAVAPYTLRPLPGAPVAVPLDWDEVDAGFDPQRITLANLFRRLAQKDDPWAGMHEAAIDSTELAHRISALRSGRRPA